MSDSEHALQTATAVTVRHAALTDIGVRREENQDSFGVLESEHLRVYIVADGMGGVRGGAVASSLAVETFKNILQNHPAPGSEAIREAVEKANNEIFSRGSSDPSLVGMGTTLVALVFVDTSLYVVSVGDSRAYLLRSGLMTQVTEDHTLVMELLRSGTITPNQAHNHPVSHMLTRSLGPSNAVEADCRLCTEGPFLGDRFLLCSDGLYNMVPEREIPKIVEGRSLQEAAAELVARANKAGGTDNITVLLVELGEGFPAQSEKKAAAVGAAEPVADSGSARVVIREEKEEVEPAEIPEVAQESIASEGLTSGSPARDDRASPAGSVDHIPELTVRSDAQKTGEDQALVDREMERQRRVFHAVGSAPEEAAPSEPVQPPYARTDPRLSILGVVLVASVLGFGLGALWFRLHGALKERQPLAEAKIPAAIAPFTVAVNAGQGIQTRGVPRISEPVTSTSSQMITQEPAVSREAVRVEQPQVMVDAVMAERIRMQRRLRSVEEILEASTGPLSGKLGEVLNQGSAERESLEISISRAQHEMEGALRARALWQERQVRLDGGEPLTLASEMMVLSDAVKEKKLAFETATWSYVREVERLKFNPEDKTAAMQVASLMNARKERLEELTEALKEAIHSGLRDVDEQIEKISKRRSELDAQLRHLDARMHACRVLLNDDREARQRVQQELLKEREYLLQEIEALTQQTEQADAAMPQPGEGSF